MQCTVSEIIKKCASINEIICRIDGDEELDGLIYTARDLLEEYYDILANTKVNI